ncbi:SMI1/KNR4 family protein [Streptomyces sp. NPDC048491]|uniref:SMI1/KNR4 family protein n=1 Tax=Streptomyces sp. NPDC048491 TaxID=3157207 RepID=UPI003449E45A
MTSPIRVSWDRIEAWLAQHAPRTCVALGPPATRSAIAEAERAVGQLFPEPLVESLLRHDGMDHRVLVPPFWSLLGTQGIVRAWRMRSRIEEAGPAGTGESDLEAVYGPWWHARWIPLRSRPFWGLSHR